MTALEQFVAEMNSGRPVVDNASDRLYYVGELEGDTCGSCGDPIPRDVDLCAACTVCPTCRGAGGWQQPSGLIVECPNGCMTDPERGAA